MVHYVAMDATTIIYYICAILSFVPALVLHEVAHGFAAYKLGDPTAKRAGRLSLNPLKHIDPFGTVVLPLLLMVMGWPIFGYAKPVPYNPSYFKDPRRGDCITGLAGPAANLGMALIAAAVAWACLPLYAAALREDTVGIKTARLSRCAVVIGSEGRGVSEKILSVSERTVKIPMRSRCESLNAAVAAAVLLWEMAR